MWLTRTFCSRLSISLPRPTSTETGKRPSADPLLAQGSAHNANAIPINSVSPTAVFIKATLGERQQRCLVDTGATVSPVNKDLVVGPIRESTLCGESLHILDMTDIPVRMNNFHVVHTFVIVEMQNQCILGADFLMANGMVVDIGHERLSWASRQTQLLLEAAAPTINQLSALLEKYSQVFVNGLDDPLSRTCAVEQSIDTGDSRPIKQRPYRIPVHLHHVVDQQVEEMLARGLIRPINSPWSSPIVLAPKKDGDYRFCVDFRRLNAVTRKDAYPMPRVDEIFDKLSGARYFSTLDLASGYWQVPVNEEDIGKTAFTFGSNHHEFTVIPFGLTNAPATFQRMMAKLLHGIKGCLVFIDDIIFFADTWDEHQRILEEVLCRIQDADLKIKRSKSQFGKESVEFLGHIVSAKGIHPNPVKVQAVQNFPTPSSFSDVRAFVGMASYYRRHVRNFTDIAASLHDLTKGGREFVGHHPRRKPLTLLRTHYPALPSFLYQISRFLSSYTPMPVIRVLGQCCHNVSVPLNTSSVMQVGR